MPDQQDPTNFYYSSDSNDDQNRDERAPNEFDLTQFNEEPQTQDESLQAPPQFEDKSFNQNQMAAMFGLDDSPTSETADEADADVAAFSEFPAEDVAQSKTQRTLKNQPFAKVGLIGGGTFVIFLVVAAFLNSVFGNNGGGRLAEQPTVEEEIEDTTSRQDQETEDLKNQLAFDKLQNDLELEKERKAAEAREKARREKEKELAAQKAAEERKNRAQDRPTTRPPIAQTTRPSRPAVLDPVRSVRPVGRPSLNRPPIPAPPPAPTSSRPVQPAIAPEVAWANATKIGSFGIVGASSDRNRSSGSSNRNTSSENATTQTVAVNPDEEGAVFNDRPTAPPKTLAFGTRVSGTLSTPISWDDTQAEDGQGAGDRFIITLDEDLRAADDSVALPRGTRLIGELKTYTASGLIDADVTSVITSTGSGEREQNLPTGVLSVSGKGGRPLVAKSKRARTNGGNPFLEIVGQTLLGVGSGIAEELNDNATSITTNGNTTSVDVDNDTNIAGGAVGGASESLLELLESRRRIRGSSNSQSPAVRYWFAKAGTSVELVVNRSAPIYGVFSSSR